MKNKNEKKINPRLLLILSVIILLGINFSVYYFYIPLRIDNAMKQEAAKFSMLNPARKFFAKKDLIINVQPLRDELHEIENDPNVSIYFEFLNTGANISVNKDSQFFPASLIKLPLAMAVAKKIEKGDWTWTNELVLMDQDKDSKFGQLYKKPIGTRLSINELVRYMLQESDNTAYLMLLRNIEPAEFDDVKNHLGLGEFFSSEGNISAKNYSVILRSLYNSSYLSDDDSEKLLAIMSQTNFNEYVASGMPKETKFAHKIGISNDQGVILDSGIVYLSRRPYVLTIMTKSYEPQIASEKMKDISQKVFDYVSNYKDE